MDTTKKGDKLEDKIFELFKDDISKGRFWAKKECCKIYKKKGYYSKDRKKNIIFDVSIEIFLPSQKTYSSLVLIECKNYNHKVPVDDVEEFFMKAQQISGGNIKTIVVSTNAFQEGTFNFSESKGVGLLRYYDRRNLDWILTRSPSSLVSSSYALNEWSTAYKGLHSDEFKSKHFDFYGCINHQYTNSLRLFISSVIKHGQDDEFNDLLSDIESINSKDTWLVKYREEFEIEEICESILREIRYGVGEVSLYDICNLLKEKNGLKVVETSDLADDVLGQISFNPLEILIDKDHDNETRKRFTLAHELGHFLLGHSEYMTGEKCHESSLDLENPDEVGIRDIKRMEWQANQFASCLLLPKSDFVQTFLSVAARNGLSNRGFGVLYLDSQKCNMDAFYSVTSPLMKRYKVSRSVVKIRLKKLGFINEPGYINKLKMLDTFELKQRKGYE